MSDYLPLSSCGPEAEQTQCDLCRSCSRPVESLSESNTLHGGEKKQDISAPTVLQQEEQHHPQPGLFECCLYRNYSGNHSLREPVLFHLCYLFHSPSFSLSLAQIIT